MTEVEEGAPSASHLHREARAAAQLCHPGIVPVHEVLMLEGLPTIVSEFVQGTTLKDFLEVRKLTFRASAELVAELAEAMDYAHGMGVVHRDVKPANVVLEAKPGERRKPLLMDFGLALRDEAEVTLTRRFWEELLRAAKLPSIFDLRRTCYFALSASAQAEMLT